MPTSAPYTGTIQFTSGNLSIYNGNSWVPVGNATITGVTASYIDPSPMPIVACGKFHEVSPGVCGCSRPYDEHPERTIDIAMGILRKLRS